MQPLDLLLAPSRLVSMIHRRIRRILFPDRGTVPAVHLGISQSVTTSEWNACVDGRALRAHCGRASTSYPSCTSTLEYFRESSSSSTINAACVCFQLSDADKHRKPAEPRSDSITLPHSNDHRGIVTGNSGCRFCGFCGMWLKPSRLGNIARCQTRCTAR